jgi:hypothetical protein
LLILVDRIASKCTNLNATLGILGNCDYLPFEALDYAVLGLHDGDVATNPDYYKSTATPDTLDDEYLTPVTKLALATILKLDNLTVTETKSVE